MQSLRQLRNQICSVLVAAALVSLQIAPTYAYAEVASTDKSETVHVQTDATGEVLSITVDETLANSSGASTLDDYSTLQDIVPDDDEQSFTSAGDNRLTWTTNGKQVSYKGVSTDISPVDVSVSYILDGESVQPDDLAGSSGHLVMRINYSISSQWRGGETTSSVSAEIPFLCMTVVMLDSDVFSDVQVTNGKVIEDKGGMAVVGFSLPGLQDSLGLRDFDADLELELPEHMEITAEVSDFALDPIYTIVTPELFSEFDSSDIDLGLTDLDEGTDALEDAMGALIDGSGSLSSALRQLADGSEGLGTGASALREALGMLPTGLSALSSGAHALSDGLTVAQEPAALLSDGTASISDAAQAAIGTSEDAQGSVKEAQVALAALHSSLNNILEATAIFDGARTAAKDAHAAASHAAETLTQLDGELAEGKAAVSSDLDGASVLVSNAQGSLVDVTTSLGEASAVLESISTEGMTEEQRQAIISAQQILSAAGGSLAGAEGELESVAQSLDAAQTGLNAITTAVPKSVSEDISTLEASAEALAIRADEIPDTSAALIDVSTAETALERSSAELDKTRGLLAGVADGAGQLGVGASALSSALEQTVMGANELAFGIDRLALSSPQLASGAEQLGEGASQLADALQSAADGSQKLTDGLSAFNNQGIKELDAALRDIGFDVDELRERLEALSDAAEAYDSFAGKAEGQSGSVRFIYKTEQIG